MKEVIAFDFGASSGRAIKATYENGKLMYKEIHRFDNVPIKKDGHIYHDIDMIVREIKTAIKTSGGADSLAFDTWGVDYGLLDDSEKLIDLPFHYRDIRTENVLNKAKEKMDFNVLYKESGNQIMSINTLFQLMCDKNLEKASTLLFMPDLFSYILTGNKISERSISSTSNMMNPVTKQWNEKILKAFSIPKKILLPPTDCGIINGEYENIKVISVCGHDTQCAVAAMPVKSDNAAFLSCGTWSLIGCETDSPILTNIANENELSNEIGAGNKINFLKNISGLWLIQQTKAELKEIGKDYSYNDLEMMARSEKPFGFFIDPDDEMLSRHGFLMDKIKGYCRKTGQDEPTTIGETVRTIYESLAMKYRYALEQIEECSNKKFEVLHLLGGGVKDNFLCQMTANSTNLPVVAGPKEATALGNIMLQLIALGEIENISEGRKIIAQTEKTTEYLPHSTKEWDEAYERFKKIIMKTEVK